jgi:hypothetical protein
MATVGLRPERPVPARRSGTVLLLPVVMALLVASVLPAGPARADGPPDPSVVAAATAAYGSVGAFAIVVAEQQIPRRGLPPRAADARSARLSSWTTGNALADRRFPTASLVKPLMAEDILHRARTGRLVLTRHDLALLQDMIRSSDDDAASTLWVRFGGGRMVTSVAARYGLTGTAPPADRSQWGETTTTARDLARFLSLLRAVAHPSDAAVLLSWMRTSTPVAADGFDQRFGVFGALPGRTAVKQGWMCCLGGKRHVHSIGVIGQRVVVLLSEVPRRVGYDAARAALTAAAGTLPRPTE